eukprot:7973532-Alexandrium_andersonii.AAC.1
MADPPNGQRRGSLHRGSLGSPSQPPRHQSPHGRERSDGATLGAASQRPKRLCNSVSQPRING